jgi:hypothetical protein
MYVRYVKFALRNKESILNIKYVQAKTAQYLSRMESIGRIQKTAMALMQKQ